MRLTLEFRSGSGLSARGSGCSAHHKSTNTQGTGCPSNHNLLQLTTSSEASRYQPELQKGSNKENPIVHWGTDIYLHTQKHIAVYQTAFLALKHTSQEQQTNPVCRRAKTPGCQMQRSRGLTSGLPTFCPSKCQKTDLAWCTKGLLKRKGTRGRIFQVFKGFLSWHNADSASFVSFSYFHSAEILLHQLLLVTARVQMLDAEIHAAI